MCPSQDPARCCCFNRADERPLKPPGSSGGGAGGGGSGSGSNGTRFSTESPAATLGQSDTKRQHDNSTSEEPLKRHRLSEADEVPSAAAGLVSPSPYHAAVHAPAPVSFNVGRMYNKQVIALQGAWMHALLMVFKAFTNVPLF